MTDPKQCCRVVLIEYDKIELVLNSTVQLHYLYLAQIDFFLRVWCACHDGCYCLTLFLHYRWTCVSETSWYEFNMVNIMYEGAGGSLVFLNVSLFHQPNKLEFQSSWRTKDLSGRCSVCMLYFSFTNLHVGCQELSSSQAPAAVHTLCKCHTLLMGSLLCSSQRAIERNPQLAFDSIDSFNFKEKKQCSY